MGVLSLLRDWVDRALGRGTATDDSDTATEEAFEYECEICGTPVDDPEDTCPLCHSSTIVPKGSSKRSPPSELDHVRKQRTRADDADDAVDSLSGVRHSGVDVLARHGDRWERVDDGFRVERRDGSTTVVDSEERLKAALLAEYGEE